MQLTALRSKDWAGLAMYTELQVIGLSKNYRVEIDIYKIGRKTKNWIAKRYKEELRIVT
jgi:hypothetical protein